MKNHLKCIVLLIVALFFAPDALAQGLTGAASPVRLGVSDEITARADHLYLMLTLATLGLTGIAAIAGFCLSVKAIRQADNRALRKAFALSLVLPICTYAAGTALVNNLWRWL